MKYAIVTGGTKGIGLGIAQMLLDEGYFVTTTYAHDDESAKSCEKMFRAKSDNFEILKVSQADRKAMEIFVKKMQEKPTIDCIVCNAGLTLRKDLKNIENEEWEQVMYANVTSNVYLIRDLYDKIPNNSRIIFIGSLMGIYPHATSLAYGVTKSAVHALAKNLVKFFDGTGTTINTIAPGFVETEWQAKKSQEHRNSIYNKTAIKRFATVEEIVEAVKFCISNSFVNGSLIEISGGYNYK